jgi:transposase-like protein
MTDSILSAQQIQVIDALSNGVSMTDAAAQAGVHRNTITNWRRNHLPFQYALADAQYDRALLFRERSEALVDQAYATLEALLADPKTPPSVRLKAALFLIEKASVPPPQKPQVMLEVKKIQVAPQPETDVHNLHNSAQTPYRRESPKIGRNEPCPCNSGKKYKQCCLNKPHPQPWETEQEAA